MPEEAVLHSGPNGEEERGTGAHVTDIRSIHLAPTQARYALGYACVCAWAAILLVSSALTTSDTLLAAPTSMLPGLITCLASLLLAHRFPSIAGRTGLVTAAALITAIGTLVCTLPATQDAPVLRVMGLALSGLFAIVIIMAWFDVFARLKPRVVIVLAGCSISLAAALCWVILASDPTLSSALTALLPMVSFVLLPAAGGAGSNTLGSVPADESPSPEAARTVLDIVAAALPLRTLIGLAITFFIVNSIGAFVPEFDRFSTAVAPASLLVPLAATAFFIASALLVRRQIDPSILYKVLMSVFAVGVLLLAFSIGISASLVFCAAIISEVMMWTVLALLAQKTPVRPHHVFALGWIAECAGSTAGQLCAPLFVEQSVVFYSVALMLIIVAVGFAFSERSLVLDVEFEKDAAGSSEAEGNAGMAGVARTLGAGSVHGATQAIAADGKPDTAQTSAASAALERPYGAARRTAAEPQAGATPADAPSLAPGAPVSQEAAKATSSASPASPDPVETFAAAHGISPRERDVLALWLAGRGLKYIENTLFISESTVKSHLRSIYRKCDTHNRDEIISLYEREMRS